MHAADQGIALAGAGLVDDLKIGQVIACDVYGAVLRPRVHENHLVDVGHVGEQRLQVLGLILGWDDDGHAWDVWPGVHVIPPCVEIKKCAAL